MNQPSPNQRRYQLVFQLRCTGIEDYDRWISLESYFIKAIRGAAFIDGHDSGSGEFNIFVHTDAPEESFAHLRPVLAEARLLDDVRVAFREFGTSSFKLVWPESDEIPFRIV